MSAKSLWGHPQKKTLPHFFSFNVATMTSTFLSVYFRTCKTTLDSGCGGKRKPLSNVLFSEIVAFPQASIVRLVSQRDWGRRVRPASY